MGKLEKLPTGGESDKSRDKNTGQPDKEERPSIEVEEDEFEEEVEEEVEDETESFRACDCKSIEMNGLRKFSKNFQLAKPTVKDQISAREPNDQKDLAYRLKPGRQN